MEVRFHESVGDFRAVTQRLYGRDPVAYTIELTLLAADDFPEDALLLTIWDDVDVVGAALQTPPYPLACSAVPDHAVEIVVAAVLARLPDLTGVRGTRHAAVAFANAWQAATERPWQVTVEERLYRLGTLVAPQGVAGVHRFVTEHDRELLVDWIESFFDETFGHPRNDAAGAQFLDAAKRKGDRFVLWVVDAAPVSMAMQRAPAAGVSRIGPVFTPVDRRGHGYGSAVTAAAADAALAEGVDGVVLFTDLANPVSNAIYQRIGFEPVADSARIEFRTLD